MQDIINQLNQSNPSATYTLNNNSIIGAWSQQSAASGIAGDTQIHADYNVTALLNPGNTYTLSEHMSASNKETGFGSGSFGPTAGQIDDSSATGSGGISLFSSSSSSFSGKTFMNKQKGFSKQFGGKPGSDTISYDFDASKVKQPLLDALNAAGYTEQKKSFFKSLFGK
ncbi:MAG: hypothetical protein ABI354_02760 [Candidatus Saccharimonadales bacterium]